MHQNKYKAYAIATQTVSKTKQIVMLYDGVIRMLQQAKTAISEKRIEDRYHLLIKANEVIAGLQSVLDFDRGGNIARVLYSYYTTMDGRIFAIHRSNNPEDCDQVIADLKTMRDVWHELDQGEEKAEEATAAAPAPVTAPVVMAEPAAPVPQPLPTENITLSA